jgi:hypothetical protein
MAKYIVDIPEVKSCGGCDLWIYDYQKNCYYCCVNRDIKDYISEFKDYEEIHKDCPLEKVEEK